jgi:hypothetical protein
LRESHPGISPERISLMKKTRHTTTQIIEKLRQADVSLGKGEKVPDICKTLGVNGADVLPLASDVRRHGSGD